MKDSFTKFAQRFSKQNIIFLPTLGIILTAQYDEVLQRTSKWWAIYVEEVYAFEARLRPRLHYTGLH
jgi:hypothetical protein